ncbi:MAG: trypsin-like serine protease [Bacteroidetes bacterium]|nr:trypsin-like serine protease [Bacteroidota bacterium]
MQEVIEHYRNVVIQIATPYSTGTGFYLKKPNLIVTNEHVVRGNKSVVVTCDGVRKCSSRVLYTDPMHDLAFLEIPEVHDLPDIPFGSDQSPQAGDKVIAVGHPFGLKYTSTQGIISNIDHQLGDIKYLQHDAALNPGNSGGPLINMRGEVIGINTFVVRDGDNIGFSLPISYLEKALDEYGKGYPEAAVRCAACLHLSFESKIEGKYCPNCGAKVEIASQIEPYQAVGLAKTIEELLVQTGHDVELSRRGPNAWEIEQGSARIMISYYEKNGLITGDAYLCRLPKEKILPLYKFLLRQNYELKGLTFSVRGQEIILSLLIFDQYLDGDTASKLFRHLFETADHFDNILVEEYGAKWIYEPEEEV